MTVLTVTTEDTPQNQVNQSQITAEKAGVNTNAKATLQNPKIQSQLQEHVIELQMNMAHLELTVERLDQVVARQDQLIQTLQRQLQLIFTQVESQDSGEGIAPFDVIADRPPHY